MLKDYGIYVFIFIFLSILFIAARVAWILYQNKLIRKMAESGVLLEVVLEKDTETDPFSVEQLWSSFHGLYVPWYKRLHKAQPYLTFEIKSENEQKEINGKIVRKKEITFNFWVPEEYKSMVKQRLFSLYPKAQINELKHDYIPGIDDRQRIIATAELGLREDSAFAIKTFDDFDTDPISAITAAMSDLGNKELAIVQVVTRPVSKDWRKKAERTLMRYEKSGKKPLKLPEWSNYLSGMFSVLFEITDAIISGLFGSKIEADVRNSSTSADKQRQKQMLEKINRNPFSFQVRILVGSPLGEEEASEKLRNIVAAFNELDGPVNGFKKELYILNRTHQFMKQRYFSSINNDDILSTVELASFAHLPNKTTFTPNLKKIQSKRTEISYDTSTEDAFAFAIDTQGNRRPVGLDLNGRMRHMYVAGMTGVGKSTLLENMIVNDIETGKGCVVVDPHGELVDEVLAKISTDREDIFVLDPADLAHPFGMNLLEISSTDPIRREMEKVLVVDSYITVMKRVFGEASIGANTDDLFRMSCSAILDHPEGGGILEMLLMLTSEVYRSRVLQFVKDPVVKNYWEVTYPALAGQGKFIVQNLNAPLNKIRRFIANGLVSNIICQKRSTIDIAGTINSGGVILARFSRGDMGFENSALLGTMLISKIQIAAMQRVSIPQSQRVPTFLYVDEFQNFVGDSGGAQSFAEILSEARKYRLGLIIAHQFVDQLRQTGSDFLLSAIFNNCGTTVTFRVGATDSKFYENVYYDKDTEKGFKANDIANLGLGEVIIRIMTKSGVQSQPFVAQTFPPLKASPYANSDLIRKRSRERISKKREDIRDTIKERMDLDSQIDTKA